MSLTVQLWATALAFMAVSGGILWWFTSRFDRKFGRPAAESTRAEPGRAS